MRLMRKKAADSSLSEGAKGILGDSEERIRLDKNIIQRFGIE